MSEVAELAAELIRRRSVTPEDAGCQELISERLLRAGFHCEPMPFGQVSNLWARRGNHAPLLCFAGHTDVVPTGPAADWLYHPYAAEIHEGMLYGRGAADMKGSLAAMVVAAERFVARHPDHAGSLAFLLTSDEEGDAVDGTRRVVEVLTRRDERIDWCVVGEPSSEQRLGDVVKNGRRGSLTGHLTVIGTQGHVAYPHLADNPVHRLLPPLALLVARTWDKGNEDFPPTSFQISNIHAGTGASNVIPGSVEVVFNFRYSTELSADELRTAVHELLDAEALDYQIQWVHSGEPFLTRGGELLEVVREAIRRVTGVETTLSTGGGTSDGRFIAPTGAQVLELGPLNATIHKVDECVAVEDLERLVEIYLAIMRRLLAA